MEDSGITERTWHNRLNGTKPLSTNDFLLYRIKLTATGMALASFPANNRI
jgi:hypothetical protein